MGIAFIGMFTLAALVLMFRAGRLRYGKAVPLAFSSFLLVFQLFQIASTVFNQDFFFGPVEHFVLSAMILSAAMHQFSNNRSMQYI